MLEWLPNKPLSLSLYLLSLNKRIRPNCQDSRPHPLCSAHSSLSVPLLSNALHPPSSQVHIFHTLRHETKRTHVTQPLSRCCQRKGLSGAFSWKATLLFLTLYHEDVRKHHVWGLKSCGMWPYSAERLQWRRIRCPQTPQNGEPQKDKTSKSVGGSFGLDPGLLT